MAQVEPSWAQDRERHEQQVQGFRFFPGRGLRATTTATPARLRFWSYAPPRPWLLAVAGLALAGVLGWQLTGGTDTGRWLAGVVLLSVLATPRITVSNHGLSFDVAGLRRVSCFGFVPLRAVLDVVVGDPPADWPAARSSSSWLPGAMATTVLYRQPDGSRAARRVWVRRAEQFSAALLGRPAVR